MNVIDRSFSAEANRIKAREATRRGRRLVLFVAASVILGATALYIWATMLCGDCGAPVQLPPA
jgi:hypothetical protein